MSFTLHDMGSENFQFTANVWNWKAALELIKSFDIISEGTVRQMGYNATGVKVDTDDAHTIGEKIPAIADPALTSPLAIPTCFGIMSIGTAQIGPIVISRKKNDRLNDAAMTGSDFTDKFVGVGVGRVKRLFKLARKHAPCVIFIDEMDGIGRRSSTTTGGFAESENNRIINTLL